MSVFKCGLTHERMTKRFKEKIHIVPDLWTTLQLPIMELLSLAIHLRLDWPLSFL